MALHFLRFRSKERDIKTDFDRGLPLQRSVGPMLKEAEYELENLRRRLSEAESKAAFLFGYGPRSQSQQDVAEDRQLNEAESFLIRGHQRARYLEKQVEKLREIQNALQEIAAPSTPSDEYVMPFK